MTQEKDLTNQDNQTPEQNLSKKAGEQVEETTKESQESKPNFSGQEHEQSSPESPQQSESGEKEDKQTEQPEAQSDKAANEEADKPFEASLSGQSAIKDESSDEREFYDFGDDSDEEDEEDEDAEETSSKSDDKDEETKLPDYDSYSREELVKELETLVEKQDVLEHKKKISLIKVAYLQKTDIEKNEELNKKQAESENEDTESEDTSEEKPQTDPLAERFDKAFEAYKAKKAEHREAQEKLMQENLNQKKAILEELRELINSEETLKKTYDDFKALQEKWKEIGMVPKSEVNELWKNYHFLVEKFFDKVKINKELRDLDLKKNLEQKIELCERAEELILEPSVNKSFKELQILHDKYRQIGPVPGDKKEEVWNRFKSATEKIHDRRRKHYENLEKEQEKNLDAKTALCEKMEDILKKEFKSVKDWNKASDEVKELMKVWRSIGFVPRQYNESIWNRFKTSVDTFFDNKKEFFKVLKEEQRDNYNRKLNLCMEAEALQDSTEWKKTTRDLINLQKEWKKIGPVSRKHSDKLWKRFRTANDKFFNAKEEHFKNQKEKEKENLEKKKELVERIKNQKFGDDKAENLKILKAFQREWMNIGFVPFDQKDSIQKEYQDIINNHMDKLSISNAEVNSAQYKSHVENLKEMPGGDRQLRKERNNMLNKINKLKEDVKLWENNTGFLANTKNADVLKKEFQEKIDKAKREIALMEAQLKMHHKD